MTTLQEDFEAWALPSGYSLRRNKALGHYTSLDTQRAWLGFQAATERAATICESLSTLSDKPIHDNDDCAAAIRGDGGQT